MLSLQAQDFQPEPGESVQRVNFNFDQVDIRLLIQTVGEVTGQRFVMDETVTGTVTVVTPGPISTDEVYATFTSVMEGHGFSIIREGEVNRIVKLAPSASLTAPVVGESESTPLSGVFTKIIKLEHISSVELKRALEPMVRGAREGAIIAVGTTNHLIITDTAGNIRRFEKIIAELDLPGASRVVELVHLEHAAADDIARQITAAMTGAESAGRQLSRQMTQVTGGGASLPSGVSVIASEHSNSLLVVGTKVQIREVLDIIGKMDVEAPTGKGRLNAVFLNYLSAEEAAKNLNALLSKKLEENQRQRISIEPSIPNNALIIDATPRDFEAVKALVEDLDRMPKQVMVEIVIAELASGENFELGIELSAIDLPDNNNTTVVGRSRPDETDVLMETVSQQMFPQGLLVGLARGTMTLADGTVVPRVPALVTALATDRDVKILSNIPLWAQNNKEATVSVVDNIPILRSTIEGGSGTARDVIQNIERIDVGIKLRLTPHVNPDNEVMLELNPSIEAIVDQGSPDTPFTPTIAKREVSTTITIPNEQSVVISGLIREDEIKDTAKVPFLGDIPFLGQLFRKDSKRKQRTNLLIFVTPHIVDDMETAAELREQLEATTGLGETNRTIHPPSQE